VRVDQFDFELPEARIALQPTEPRDAARMLIVRQHAPFADTIVRDLPDFLRPGDAVVLNDTRVIPAALEGVRTRAGVDARVTFNLTKRVDGQTWRAFARPAKKLVVGDTVHFGGAGGVPARVSAKLDAGEVALAFDLSAGALDAAIAAVGTTPLPPYIALKRKPDASDVATYQTVYARVPGAVAAPTAGLHVTDGLLSAIEAAGALRHFVTLHVGAGTFLPVKVDDTRDHVMHSEWCEVSAETAAALNAVKARGGRIVAVGTTALRVLESATTPEGVVQSFAGETSIFITPGYRFRAVDMLMTNFHLPRSTLFMLVSAFAGTDTMRAAYMHAIATGYRFYSYGDASLLFRADGTGTGTT
jgi:S-adenosylmethionine:tRNA ribosyltransferase-isomerase